MDYWTRQMGLAVALSPNRKYICGVLSLNFGVDFALWCLLVKRWCVLEKLIGLVVKSFKSFEH
jgi:hypothetical protein